MRKRYGKIQDKSLVRRYRRKLSIRSKVDGSEERPRVAVTRSNKNLRVQVVDDLKGKTLFSMETFGKKSVGKGNTIDSAKAMGAKVAEELKGKKINSAVFDRAGYRYHGVVAALAESIRENGIQV